MVEWWFRKSAKFHTLYDEIPILRWTIARIATSISFHEDDNIEGNPMREAKSQYRMWLTDDDSLAPKSGDTVSSF
jgi:hypothetical protein